jgi:Fic family protein
MTNREFYQAIVEGAVVTAEQATFAAEAIAKLDKRNEKRAATPSKTAIANAPIKATIAELLKEKKAYLPAAIIAQAVDITTQKASALCRQLVEEGVLTVADAKIKGKGKVKAYAYIGDVEGEVDANAEEG